MVILGDEGRTYNAPSAVLKVPEEQTRQCVRSSLGQEPRKRTAPILEFVATALVWPKNLRTSGLPIPFDRRRRDSCVQWHTPNTGTRRLYCGQEGVHVVRRDGDPHGNNPRRSASKRV